MQARKAGFILQLSLGGRPSCSAFWGALTGPICGARQGIGSASAFLIQRGAGFYATRLQCIPRGRGWHAARALLCRVQTGAESASAS
eukprot:1936380-Alexandrium_andersonii.AAC.1